MSQTAAIVLVRHRFCGRGHESGCGLKISRPLCARLFYTSPLPWKILYPPLLKTIICNNMFNLHI